RHVTTYPAELLRKYKDLHEARVEQLTEITEDLRTVPLVVDIPVGSHADPIPLVQVLTAIMAAGRYPDDQRRIYIDLLGIAGRDRDAAFGTEPRNWTEFAITRHMSSLRHPTSVDHLSVFAFGPIPLLIDIGRQLGDKLAVSTFNLHRMPKGWQWPADAR